MKQPARIRAAHDIFRTAPAAIDRAPADPSDRSIRTGYYYPAPALLNVRTELGHCDRPGTSVYRPTSTGGGGRYVVNTKVRASLKVTPTKRRINALGHGSRELCFVVIPMATSESRARLFADVPTHDATTLSA